MYAFEYQRAKSVADAAAVLAKSGGKALAGGQSLVGAMKLRLANPGTLVDLSGIAELKGINKEGGALVIGALATHAEVAASSAVRQAIPALAALAEGIGDRQVRNRGTLGGSLANNDPAADYPAAVLGLGATIHTNRRKIEADKYFTGLFSTALMPGEIIVSIRFPIPERAGYAKFEQRASRYCLVSVFVAKAKGGMFSSGEVRVAVSGAGNNGVFRVPAMEQALKANYAAA